MLASHLLGESRASTCSAVSSTSITARPETLGHGDASSFYIGFMRWHPSAPGAPGDAVASTAAAQDPARFAPQVVRYAGKAGIDPQLLMAILYNESYKPHDPAMERAWQQIKPDAAFGVANMHKAAFDDTKRGRDFAGRDWQELPDDPDLAIEAAAWYLHDLARQLPTNWPPRTPATSCSLSATTPEPAA
jgi:hypothetical protein